MSYLRNKEPKPPVVHFVRPWKYATMTSCGQYAFERAAVASEPRGAQRTNILVAYEVSEVTCGSCVRTVEYRKAKEKAMAPKHEATVGIPTQGSESEWAKVGTAVTEGIQEGMANAMLGHNESFGANEPAIHAMTKRGTPAPLCGDSMERGYSTMDGGAINCRDCLQHPEFIRRNNMFTEMMSPTLADGEREPIAIVHDREDQEDYGTPLWTHDCDACVYLGDSNGNDLYWCSQGGGPNISTVIARRSNDGPDYISGIAHARDNEALALAVVRAFRAGLLNDTDLSWL